MLGATDSLRRDSTQIPARNSSCTQSVAAIKLAGATCTEEAHAAYLFSFLSPRLPLLGPGFSQA